MMDEQVQERILMADLLAEQAEALVSGLKIYFYATGDLDLEFGLQADGYLRCAVFVRYVKLSPAKRKQMEFFCQGGAHGLKVAQERLVDKVRSGYYSVPA